MCSLGPSQKSQPSACLKVRKLRSSEYERRHPGRTSAPTGRGPCWSGCHSRAASEGCAQPDHPGAGQRRTVGEGQVGPGPRREGKDKDPYRLRRHPPRGRPPLFQVHALGQSRGDSRCPARAKWRLPPRASHRRVPEQTSGQTPGKAHGNSHWKANGNSHWKAHWKAHGATLAWTPGPIPGRETSGRSPCPCPPAPSRGGGSMPGLVSASPDGPGLLVHLAGISEGVFLVRGLR